MDNDHSITRELRSFTKDPLLGYASQEQHIEQLTAIADRIDAALTERYVELPKDADGEYVHIGDDMETLIQAFRGEHCKVEYITLTANGWEVDGDTPDSMRHYHAPTVEDVLRDMHVKLDEVAALHADEPTDSDERERDVARIYAEYAEKLQLRGDSE